MGAMTERMLALPARELRWCFAANRWGARPLITRFFAIVSRLGDGPAWYAVIASLPLFFGASAAAASLHLGVTAAASATIYRTLKRYTKRPRPFRRHDGIVAHVAPLDEFSFPSGHTLHAVTLTLVMCWYFPMMAVVLVPFAVAVAVSRVVLGLHYPSDVLAATVIGCGLASGSIAFAEALDLVRFAIGG